MDEFDVEEDSFPEELDPSEIAVDPDCKYPDIKVQLVGRDGNAFSIIGFVKAGLKEAGISREEQQAWLAEAMSQPSYEMLLNTAGKWVAIY